MQFLIRAGQGGMETGQNRRELLHFRVRLGCLDPFAGRSNLRFDGRSASGGVFRDCQIVGCGVLDSRYRTVGALPTDNDRSLRRTELSFHGVKKPTAI